MTKTQVIPLAGSDRLSLYERGIEFDPGGLAGELSELAQVIAGHPAWEGDSAAQELHERRVAERRRSREVPEWFSAQDLLPEPWQRVVVEAG